ncbi:MAG: EAL domain-containing protein [Gammaproteobacteria bacterium]|nr:MAG: EAL domain-containing protein [Gammaproteobacteria bacterium]
MMARQSDNTRSIRARLMNNLYWGVLGGIAVIAVLAIGGLVLMANERLRQDASVLARVLGERSRAALVFADHEAARRLLDTARLNEAIERVCLYDAQGRLFAAFRALDGTSSCTQRLTSTSDMKRLRSWDLLHLQVQAPIRDDGVLLGHVVVQANRDAMYRTVANFLALFLILVVLVSFITLRRARQRLEGVLIPLHQLHDSATEMARNPLSERRARRLSDDEVGELVEAFNHMLDAIADKHRSLEQSEIRFRTLATSSPVGLCEWSPDGRAVYANPRWMQMTGLLSDALTRTHFEHNIHNEDRAEYVRAVSSAMASPGVHVVEYRYHNPFSIQDIHLLEYMAPMLDEGGRVRSIISSLVDVSAQKEAQQELEHMAFHDALTGLSNRRFFCEHLTLVLAEARHKEMIGAVCLLDLDEFKKINDTLGHGIGDALLQEVAKRICAALYEHDVVSRMGGDEFLLLLTDLEAEEQAGDIAARVMEVVSRPSRIGDYEINITCSIGVALFPRDGLDSERLIKNADLALYEAKRRGRNQAHFYSARLDARVRRNMQIEQRLRKALAEDGLSLHIQPILDTHRQDVCWAEVLLRWNDPELGNVSPAELVPVAESMGAIVDIGRWVMRRICRDLQEHRQKLEAVGIRGVSINLSPRQFYSRGLVQEIREDILDHGVEPERLGFEITESLVMQDLGLAVEIMREIRDLGCRLYMDDFGTGYSSLASLKAFPIDTLKIDRSFIMEIPGSRRDADIATAIVAMAHNLGLSVVAEGVETSAQQDFLIDHGCEYLQGFLICRPAPIIDVIRVLQGPTEHAGQGR